MWCIVIVVCFIQIWIWIRLLFCSSRQKVLHSCFYVVKRGKTEIFDLIFLIGRWHYDLQKWKLFWKLWYDSQIRFVPQSAPLLFPDKHQTLGENRRFWTFAILNLIFFNVKSYPWNKQNLFAQCGALTETEIKRLQYVYSISITLFIQ